MKKNVYLFLLFLLGASLSFAQQEGNQQPNLNLAMTGGAISVTIGGNFITNGTFPANISERVDQFVTRIYNVFEKEAASQFGREKLQSKFSFRNILLKRSSGETIKINLVKFRKTGDFNENPRLKNDDIIIFPPTDIERNFVSVSGAVVSPGTYQYFEGDKLSDILMLCDGVNKAYSNVTEVKINRVSPDGTKMDEVIVPLSSDTELKPGDRVVVLGKEPEGKEYSVLVLGEVNMPGRIPITKNHSTLKEVIERAGGLKESASLKRSRLITGSSVPYLFSSEYGFSLSDYYANENYRFVNNPDFNVMNKTVQLEDYMMVRNSDLTIDDTTFFFMENQLRVLNQGTSRDFSEIGNPNSEIANHIVRDKDVILVPPKNNNIYVFGQVARAGNIVYKPGENIDYYISQAGGVGEFANADEIALIKGTTRQWIKPDKKTKLIVEEGDYIFVPKKPIRTFDQYVSMWSSYIGILGSVATIVLLLVQLGK
jgi:protein involved in polysaccharide export with SLBB domain